MRPIPLGLAAILMSIGAPALAVSAIAVAPGGRLSVDLSIGGSIDVRGTDGDKLTYEVLGDEIDVVVDRSGNQIRLAADRRHPFERRGRVELKIRVPRRFDLDLHTTGGGMTISGVEGKIEGETLGGDLVLSNLRGELQLTTLGGDIELTDSNVDGKLTTYGGRVRFSRVEGDIDASSLGGDVIFDDVRGSGQEVRISTMGGNIDVPDAPHGADLQTMGGHIEVERAQDHVNAKTMGGNIRIGEVDGWVRATTIGGNVDVHVSGFTGSDRDIALSTHAGNITLTLPANAGVHIDATVTFTKRSRQNYRIDSDYPLQIRQTEDWTFGAGEPTKFVYGTGEVGGGKHRVKLEAVNGDITIRRRP